MSFETHQVDELNASLRRRSFSRVCIASVLSGVVLTLASMFFCMSLAAALGYWSYQPEGLPELGPQFWKIASVAWMFSVFVGTLSASIACRSKEMKDGLLNAAVTWAGSYLLFGGIALSIVQTNLNAMLGTPTIGLFWHGFVGDALALVSGLVGGVVGCWIERGSIFKSFQMEDSEIFDGVPTHF
jgi:hypothetical protein